VRRNGRGGASACRRGRRRKRKKEGVSGKFLATTHRRGYSPSHQFYLSLGSLVCGVEK